MVSGMYGAAPPGSNGWHKRECQHTHCARASVAMHNHAISALVLGRITGGIGSGQRRADVGEATVVSIQADSGLRIEMRQSKYLNNLVEQDHRAVKRITRPMLGFKTFRCARILITGIEVMHMISKGQLIGIKDQASSAANQFYSRAF